MPYKEHIIERVRWTVTELANELGVSASNVREWDEAFNLITTRDNHGNRVILPAERALIIKIFALQGLVTMKGIGRLLKLGVIDAALQVHRPDMVVKNTDGIPLE